MTRAPGAAKGSLSSPSLSHLRAQPACSQKHEPLLSLTHLCPLPPSCVWTGALWPCKRGLPLPIHSLTFRALLCELQALLCKLRTPFAHFSQRLAFHLMVPRSSFYTSDPANPGLHRGCATDTHSQHLACGPLGSRHLLVQMWEETAGRDRQSPLSGAHARQLSPPPAPLPVRPHPLFPGAPSCRRLGAA